MPKKNARNTDVKFSVFSIIHAYSVHIIMCVCRQFRFPPLHAWKVPSKVFISRLRHLRHARVQNSTYTHGRTGLLVTTSNVQAANLTYSIYTGSRRRRSRSDPSPSKRVARHARGSEMNLDALDAMGNGSAPRETHRMHTRCARPPFRFRPPRVGTTVDLEVAGDEPRPSGMNDAPKVDGRSCGAHTR